MEIADQMEQFSYQNVNSQRSSEIDIHSDKIYQTEYRISSTDNQQRLVPQSMTFLITSSAPSLYADVRRRKMHIILTGLFSEVPSLNGIVRYRST